MRLERLANSLEFCGPLSAGLWERTRRGGLGSDIIRFAVCQRSLWLLRSVADRWSRGVRAEAHRIGKGTSHACGCVCQGQSRSSGLPDQNILGASVQAPSLVLGMWDSDAKRLTEMRHNYSSGDDTRHRSHPLVPGWALGPLSTPLLPVFHLWESRQTAGASADECDVQTCLPATGC